jgi:hypothetical protein
LISFLTTGEFSWKLGQTGYASKAGVSAQGRAVGPQQCVSGSSVIAGASKALLCLSETFVSCNALKTGFSLSGNPTFQRMSQTSMNADSITMVF